MNKIFDLPDKTFCNKFEYCEDCPCFEEYPIYDEDGYEEDYWVQCNRLNCNECVNHIDIFDENNMKK